MADEAPKFQNPNNLDNQSIGGSGLPTSSSDPGKDPAGSGPRPNTVGPGSAPEGKAGPSFMKE
jgi:hypothetical protein